MKIDKYKVKKNIRGTLHLDIIKNGKIISSEEHNLIVDTSCKVLAQLLGGVGVYTDKAVNKIHFGTGNLPVGLAKTVLDGTVFSKAIDSVTYDGIGAPNDIQFNFTLGAAEFNGNDIWQFGLASTDGVLFSMLSRNPSKSYPIEKDTDVTIAGWWKIQFVNLAS